MSFKTVVFIAVISFVSGSVIAAKIPLSCPENEEPTDCVNPCLPTCVQPFNVTCNFLVCNAGCACKAGYIRTAPLGTCVAVENCGEYCKTNQEYNSCGSVCPDTCSPYNKGGCIDVCVKGCYCKKDYVLQNLLGECVLQTACSTAH